MKRILGKDLEVGAIGLGIMGMDHGYGEPADRNDMKRLIARSIELGGDFFDTAPVYGEQNEKLLGEALRGRRDRAVIATKFGITGQRIINGKLENILDSSPRSIKRQVEISLKNLQTDYIDLYYQHRVDPNVEPEAVARVMKELVKEGKIRYWGVSNAPIDYILKAHAVLPVTAMENQYSMLFRAPEKELFAFCERNNIGFVAYSPLANGFLSGKFNGTKGESDLRNIMGRFRPEVMAKNQAAIEYLKELAGTKNATPAQIVLAWHLAQRAFIVPIPGTTKMSRLEENLGAMKLNLSAEELANINAKLDEMDLDETHF